MNDFYQDFYEIQKIIDSLKSGNKLEKNLKKLAHEFSLEYSDFNFYYKLHLIDKMLFQKLIQRSRKSNRQILIEVFENHKEMMNNLLDGIIKGPKQIKIKKEYAYKILDFIEERKDQISEGHYLQAVDLLKRYY